MRSSKVVACRANLHTESVTGVNPERVEVRQDGVTISAPPEAVAFDFERFVRDDYGSVVAAVGLTVGSNDLAEDAVQEVLARLVARPPSQPLRSPAGYVTVAACNRVRDIARSQAAEKRATDRLANHAPVKPGHDGSGIGEHAALTEALASLAPQQQQVCVLHYYIDLPVTEVAALLGVSEGSVKTQLHRARQRLAAALGSEHDGESNDG